jgi:hypothetical protein
VEKGGNGMNAFEEYRERKNTAYYLKLRETVRKIVAQRRLFSCMNDTKWLKLQQAVEILPFPPPYDVKCLTDKDDDSAGAFSCIPAYIGDWSSYWEEGAPAFLNIEWMKVWPVRGIYRGRLIPDEVQDETAEFAAVLLKLAIPYEEENGIFTIYGYK